MANPHILIVEARFYADLADEMVAGAVEAIEAAGGTWDRLDVPGALEIPAAISMADAGEAKEYDGYVALAALFAVKRATMIMFAVKVPVRCKT